MTRALGTSVGLLALLASGLLALAPGSASAAGDHGRQVAAKNHLKGAPKVGSCYRMDRKELNAPTYSEHAVSCRKAHSSVVVAVKQLPRGTKLKGGSPGVQRAFYRTCEPALQRKIGGNVLQAGLSAYGMAYFVPTHQQQKKGARWLRCDMIRYQNGAPGTLPSHLKLGSFPFAPKASLCLSAGSLHYTACATKHTYRATFIRKLKGHYPKAQSARDRIARMCDHHVTSHHFRYVISEQAAWANGYRLLTCFSENRH